MKTELKDVSATRKELVIEIPVAEVDSAIDRVSAVYRRRARVPGFRPGKVPATVVRRRYRDQILHDVAQDLVPSAIDTAVREHGHRPLEMPRVSDLTLEEGAPLTFRASFETLPAVEPGDYSSFTLRRRPAVFEPDAVDQALEQLRQNAARFEPVEDRPAQAGDTITADVTRQTIAGGGAAGSDEAGSDEAGSDEAGSGEAGSGEAGSGEAGSGAARAGEPESHEDVAIEIGAAENPPGLDAEVTGLSVGDAKTFRLTYPDDYASETLAGATVEFSVTVKAIRLRVLPALDDELAKDVGDFQSLDELRERVAEDLQQRAERERDREVRGDLLKQLSSRAGDIEVPDVLIAREVDQRVEELVRRLIDQRVDPTRANIDWEQFRESQREPATEAVRTTLVLDEIARRESLEVSDADVDQQVERHAERLGRTPSAVRAQLEKDDGLARVRESMRREKAIDFLMARATLVEA